MATSPAAPEYGAAPKATGKPRELEDSLNLYLFHPLSRRIALALSRTPVSPNMVSVFGGLLVVAAGFIYTQQSETSWVLLAFALHLLWHVFDGADGDLARLTGKASPVGELVDGVCDYASHIVVYVLLAAFLDNWIGGWAWVMSAIAGGSRIAQSNHAESQRRIYLWRVYGVPWLQQTQASDENALARRGLFGRIFAPFAKGYVALANLLSPFSREIDEAMTGSGGPERDRYRTIYRREAARALRLQLLLGANPRTVVLGFSMLAGSPLWFFLFEAGLNVLLAMSIAEQRKLNRRMEAIIAADRAMHPV